MSIDAIRGSSYDKGTINATSSDGGRKQMMDISMVDTPGRSTVAVTSERTILRPVDHQALFAALDAAPGPTERLRIAFARHRDTIASR